MPKGSGIPQTDKVGSVTRAQLREIAEKKMADLNANDIDAGREDHRRHRPVDGHHRQGLTSATGSTIRSWEGARDRGPPSDHRSNRHAAQQGLPQGRRGRSTASKLYTPAEAVKLAKETTPTKFDATVEVAMRLGVDPRKADQMVRGVVNLPHGTGKTARVIVFAAGAKAEEAEAAGADEVGTDELVARIQGGWLDFDAAIATPGPDGQDRPDRADPGPARPDAEPEDRHGHHGRHQGGHRTSRAARSPSGWTSTPTCT